MGKPQTKWECIMRKDIIEASKLHFKAHIEKHRINVEVIDKK